MSPPLKASIPGAGFQSPIPVQNTTFKLLSLLSLQPTFVPLQVSAIEKLLTSFIKPLQHDNIGTPGASFLYQGCVIVLFFPHGNGWLLMVDLPVVRLGSCGLACT